MTKKWPKWPTVTNEGGHIFRLWNHCNYYVFTTMTKWPLKISKKKWFNIYSSKKVCQKSLVIGSQGALAIGSTWIEGDQRVTNVTKMTNFSGHWWSLVVIDGVKFIGNFPTKIRKKAVQNPTKYGIMIVWYFIHLFILYHTSLITL